MEKEKLEKNNEFNIDKLIYSKNNLLYHLFSIKNAIKTYEDYKEKNYFGVINQHELDMFYKKEKLIKKEVLKLEKKIIYSINSFELEKLYLKEKLLNKTLIKIEKKLVDVENKFNKKIL